MKQRLITAFLGLAIFCPILFLSNDIVFRICFAVISAISAFEMLKCAGCIKKYLLSVPLIAFALAMPLIISLESNKWYIVTLGIMFYCMITLVLSNGSVSAQDAGASFIGVLFISLSYACVAIIREEFSYAFVLVYLGAWISDTFAYIVGRAIGKHKLLPNISPKKTVEGAIGGVIADMIVFPLFGLIMLWFTDFNVDFLLLSVLGLAVAVISQLGDLVMSAIKRSYGVKDFGKVFPGHGGFLDRFDSTFTVAPLMCLALNIFNILY